jgi:hypothetical protein
MIDSIPNDSIQHKAIFTNALQTPIFHKSHSLTRKADILGTRAKQAMDKNIA